MISINLKATQKELCNAQIAKGLKYVIYNDIEHDE